MWLSLLNLIAFAYTPLYHGGSSAIKWKRKAPILEISKNIIPNIQFKDKVIDKKSLKLISFHHKGAQKHVKLGRYIQIIHHDY